MTTSTLAQQLREAKHVVVFTGAGASAESGTPTFRDEVTGLWERFDPAHLAASEPFRADPSLCWGWYEWRRQKVNQAQPNGVHLAIAKPAKHMPKLTVVTQKLGPSRLHPVRFWMRSSSNLPSGIGDIVRKKTTFFCTAFLISAAEIGLSKMVKSIKR